MESGKSSRLHFTHGGVLVGISCIHNVEYKNENVRIK